MVFTVVCPVSAIENPTHNLSIGLRSFFDKGNHDALVDKTDAAHLIFVENNRSTSEGSLAMEILGLIYETGSEPNEEKYMEVLINIMKTYEMENASAISSQHEMDNLKAVEDYALDALDIGIGLLPNMIQFSGGTQQITTWIETALSGLSDMADNTYEWIKGVSKLETLVQNYSKHDDFLALIAFQGTGNLKSAAEKLRVNMQEAMKIRLETYSDMAENDSANYTMYFFEDVFFTALEQTKLYEADSGFKGFVNLGSKVMANWNALTLGIDIGMFVADIAVGTSDVINRVLEMKAVYDISKIIQSELQRYYWDFPESYSNSSDYMVEKYITYANYLIACRIRGEYCMYSMLAKDSRLCAYFGEESANAAARVYNRLTAKLAGIKQELDLIMNAMVVNMGSEMPYEAVNMNSQWNVFDVNGNLYHNYMLRIYDKQSLINFVRTGVADIPDPTVVEHVVDSTEPLQISLEAGYAYTFEFIDGADPSKITFLTVGVTDNDPLITSVIDVKTEFGNSNKKLTQINQYSNNELSRTMVFTYNGDNLLTKISGTDYYNNAVSDEYVISCFYDDEGRYIRGELSYAPWAYDEYQYNEQGQLVFSHQYEGGNCTYKYDDFGLLIQTNSIGSVCETITEYQYDTSDLPAWAKITYVDETGTVLGRGECVFNYDSMGRAISQSAWTVSESQIMSDNTTETIISYDYRPFTVTTGTSGDGATYVSANIQDIMGSQIWSIFLDDMQLFTDDEGYLTQAISDDMQYRFYYDGVLDASLDIKTNSSTSSEATNVHTYDEAEKLLYEYLGNEYGFEELEVRQFTPAGYQGIYFEMTLTAEGGAPILVRDVYTVDLDTGEVKVRTAESYRFVCDLW